MKNLKTEIQTIIKKKMVEFWATLKINTTSTMKKNHWVIKSSWETDYKWASRSKYWSTENVYFKKLQKRKLTEPPCAVLSPSVMSNSLRPHGL